MAKASNKKLGGRGGGPITESNSYGEIQIAPDVVAAVVRKYTLEVPGVVRLAGQSFVGGLAEMFGRGSQHSSIQVEWDGDRVDLSVTIVIRFGEHVPTVAAHVQNVCRKYIEEITGKQVGKVNVVVHGLEDTDAPPEEGSAEAAYDRLEM